MAFIWREELLVGDEKVDSQHKELFRIVNTLIDACHAGKGLDVVDDIMKFLLDYTVQHFNGEEALQRSVGFPDHQNHKGLHEAFKAHAKELYEELKAKGPSAVFVTKVNSTVGEWLITHIKKEDKKLGEHMKAKGH